MVHGWGCLGSLSLFHIFITQVQGRDQLLDQIWDHILSLHRVMLASGAKTDLDTSRCGSMGGVTGLVVKCSQYLPTAKGRCSCRLEQYQCKPRYRPSESGGDKISGKFIQILLWTLSGSGPEKRACNQGVTMCWAPPCSGQWVGGGGQ